jgi:hypothetical protein
VIEIGHPSQLTPQQFSESLVPLGEDLKNVPVSTSHHVAAARDVLVWNVLVKEVAHRVDKNFPWTSPMQWLIEPFGNESEIEPLLERVSRHTAETFREQLRIAEFAARAHLRAAADGVPGCVRPFDCGPVAHGV